MTAIIPFPGRPVGRDLTPPSRERQLDRVLPELPPELRTQVDRLLDGPSRYDGAGAELDDADFVLPPPEPVFHPAAAPAAERMRVEREQLADVATLFAWLKPIAISVANPPADEAAALAFATVLHMTCELPRRVLQAATPEATLFGYWPTAGQVQALLERYDAHHRNGLAVLDKVARAKPSAFRPGPARASTEVYDPGPAPDWTTSRDLHPSGPNYIPPGDDMEGGKAPETFVADRADLERQMAAFTPEEIERSRAMAAARRARLGLAPPPEAKP